MQLPNPPLWQRAIEAQMSALSGLQNFVTGEPLSSGDRRHVKMMLDLVIEAEPFGWSVASIEAVIEASNSIPTDTHLNRWNLGTKTIWWWFENPLIIPYESSDGKVHAISGQWQYDDDEGDYFLVSMWYRPAVDSPLTPAHSYLWRQNSTIEKVVEDQRRIFERKKDKPFYTKERHTQALYAVEYLGKFILAALVWLDQKILIANVPHVERHRRKEYQRKIGRPPLVKVILLRKYERPIDESNALATGASYSHRFVVSGHWRNQACGPNWSDTRLRFIMPFIKGPDDKPLVVRPKVYEVVR